MIEAEVSTGFPTEDTVAELKEQVHQTEEEKRLMQEYYNLLEKNGYSHRGARRKMQRRRNDNKVFTLGSYRYGR